MHMTYHIIHIHIHIPYSIFHITYTYTYTYTNMCKQYILHDAGFSGATSASPENQERSHHDL